jgi:hypothetical protein
MKSRKKVSRAGTPFRPWSADELAFLREHASTQKASWIGEQIGRTESAVQQARARNGMDTPMPDRPRPKDAEVRRLHAKGWSDREIGKALGELRETVRAWRRRLRLPANGWTEHQRKQQGRRTMKQLAAAGLKSMAELRVQAFRRFAREHGWPEDLPPRCVQIMELLSAGGPQTREQLCRALGLTWLGSRSSMKSSCDGGSYLSLLQRRGLVVRLKRALVRKGKGRSVDVYSLPLDIELPVLLVERAISSLSFP